MLDYLKEELNRKEGLPPLPPLYADLVTSEAKKSSQVPITSGPSLITFLIQDCLEWLEKMHNFSKSLFW